MMSSTKGPDEPTVEPADEGDGVEARTMPIPVTVMVPRSDEGPDVLAFQPMALDVSLSPIVVAGVTVNAITRIWSEGDTRRCGLCPVCTANHAHNYCTLQVARPVPATKEELRTLDTRGMRWAPLV